MNGKKNDKNKSNKILEEELDEEDDSVIDTDQSAELNTANLTETNKSKAKFKDATDEEDENDDDEDDDEYDDDVAPEIGTKFITLEDFKGEEKGDLPFKNKEILTLIKIK